MATLADHLDAYRNTPELEQVLAGHATFQGSLRRVYGLQFEPAQLCDPNPDGLETHIDILEPFSHDTLSRENLTLEGVREDFTRYFGMRPSYDNRNLIMLSITTLGVGTGSGVLLSAVAASAIPSLAGWVGIPAALCLAVYSTIRTQKSLPKGSDGSFNEYRKLSNAAFDADRFIPKYRSRWIAQEIERRARA